MKNRKCSFRTIKSYSFVFMLLFFSVFIIYTTPQSQAAENDLELTYTSSSWQTGYTLAITLKNTTSRTIDGWKLYLNNADFSITNAWCVSKVLSGNSIVFSPESWNKSIAPGQSVSFGFNGTGTLNKNFSYTITTGNEGAIQTAGPITTPTTKPIFTSSPVPSIAPTTIPTQSPSFSIQIPSFSSLTTNAKLPNPFEFKTGTMKGLQVASQSQWDNRRAEIRALAQAFEYGVKPATPKNVTGSFNNNAITVTCTENGKTTSFKCSIQYPTTGKAPYPAIIGVNMNTLNTSEILKLGVALITLPADDIGQEVNGSSRGKGKFFDIYGSNYDAGALITWAWGTDCLIDALEKTPTAKIDPSKLGVTGGSRNGKGALAIGAFCDRIALTIPQESGNGGSSGWRTADAMMANGKNVQTLSEIIGENCWFAKTLNQFSGHTTKLPYDHHEILGLCAPRGLLLIENPDFEWLGGESGYNTSCAARMIYQALGVSNNIGYSSIGGHGHCSFPSSQQPELTAYIRHFLLGENTAIGTWRNDSNYIFNQTQWINWTIPKY